MRYFICNTLEILIFLLFFAYGLSTYTYDVLKPQFQRNFHKSCSKYPFYQSYESRLTNPTGKYVIYHFQLNGWRNGGLGDRIAGLLNAAEMAIRFNRTLIIRSDTGFDKLFRPYIPESLNNDSAWNNISYNPKNLQWTMYNASYEESDDTNLEMYNCVNTNIRMSEFCSQAWADPKQIVLTHLGNRAYICHWYNEREIVPAHQILLQSIGGRENNDLMEVAGCMLRLVMWPTDSLWSMVDEAIESHKQDLKRRGLVKHHGVELLWRYLITLHFRCGDAGYVHRGPYDIACMHSEIISNTTVDGEVKLEYNIPPHTETGYMGYGTPLDVARCAEKVVMNLTAQSQIDWQSFLNQEEIDAKQDHHGKRSLRHRKMSDKLNISEELEFRTLVHIASDNSGSSRQMNETLNWPNAFISPNGCHVELEPTFECLRLTVTYWMIMVLSDIIITPGNNRIPNSAFPRYASVYGLKGDVLRDSKQCENILSRKSLSHLQHGNWNC